MSKFRSIVEKKIASISPAIVDKGICDYLEEVLELINRHPTSAMVTLGTAAHEFVNKIIIEAKKPPERNFHRAIARAGAGIRSEKIFPLHILPLHYEQSLDRISEARNTAAHPPAKDKEPKKKLIINTDKVEESLNDFLRVVEWYYSDHKEFVTIYDRQAAGPAHILRLFRLRIRTRGTTLFPEKVEQLVDALGEGTGVVVIAGAPGVGKSRVAAALFEPLANASLLPVRFEDNDIDILPRGISRLQGQYPDKQICLVLDEDHQHPIRDQAFFVQFLSSDVFRMIQDQHLLVLVLRTSTYEYLTKQKYLARASVVGIEGNQQKLDQYQWWGLDSPLTKKEKVWIIRIASNERGYLITLLVDMIGIPFIKKMRKDKKNEADALDQVDITNQDLLETVNQHLIANQPERRQSILEALYIAGEMASFVPFSLVEAILRTREKQVDLREVKEEFDRLIEDQLISHHDVYISGRLASWRLSHDLINEALSMRLQKKQHDLPNSEQVVQTAARFMQIHAGRNLNAFVRGLELWTSLVVGPYYRETLPLIQAISHAAIAPRQQPLAADELIKAIGAAVNWTRWRFPSVDRPDYAVLFQHLQVLAGIVAEYITVEHVVGICKGELVEVMVLGNQTAHCGIQSGQLPQHPAFEIQIGYIEPLSNIGQICTAKDNEEVLSQLSDFFFQLRYVQLLMWAKKWEEAGKVAEQVIFDAADKEKDDICSAISRVPVVAWAYLEGGYVDAAKEVYRKAAQKASSMEGMALLASLYEENGRIIENGGTKKHRNFLHFMSEERVRIRKSVEQEYGIAIIGNFPDHAIGSVIASQLKSIDLPSTLFYSHELQELDDVFPVRGIIVLGGHLAVGIEKLIRPVLQESQFIETINRAEEKDISSLDFKVGDIPAVWIAGNKPWHMISGGRDWLASHKYKDFVQKIN